jgi:hypothetical protein
VNQNLSTQQQPPPNGGPRDIDNRLGEALRRWVWRHDTGKLKWADLPDSAKDGWRNAAASWRASILADVGLTVGILDR